MIPHHSEKVRTQFQVFHTCMCMEDTDIRYFSNSQNRKGYSPPKGNVFTPMIRTYGFVWNPPVAGKIFRTYN